MKKVLLLSFALLSMTMVAQSDKEMKCEQKFQTTRYKKVESWKDQNTNCCGAVQWIAVEYSDGMYQKLFRVKSTGQYYIQNTGFEKMYFYRSESEAIRALYIYSCSNVFTERGLVK